MKFKKIISRKPL